MLVWQNALFMLLCAVNALQAIKTVYLFLIGRHSLDVPYTWSYWDLIWWCAYVYLTHKSSVQICSEVENGSTPHYSLDFFGVVLVSQIVCIAGFYSLSGYILWIVPGYAVYKLGGYVLSYFGFFKGGRGKGDQEDADQDPASQKRQAKKERKEARMEKQGGVRYKK